MEGLSGTCRYSACLQYLARHRTFQGWTDTLLDFSERTVQDASIRDTTVANADSSRCSSLPSCLPGLLGLLWTPLRPRLRLRRHPEIRNGGAVGHDALDVAAAAGETRLLVSAARF